ncbi:MAG TPA: cytochrome d ubiquinol oxidase subunit II [Pseudonocardiaceae bacterium]|jgi:cytochrome d ubiquinol oxidase subunit II|nr:cytochrome d ubiquinol oxidase subunit II [Pseudonocardiaceae bacterium]
MSLPTLWFCVIAFFWVGYLFLDGFDLGVGMLLPIIGRGETGRRVLLNTIGPVWDGNEVWLVVAGGATFAAFPDWYAALFSGAYLPMLMVLVALIGRGVALEYRGKIDAPRWRRGWDAVIVVGSLLIALGVGLLMAVIALGLPLDAQGNRVGSAFAAVRPDTLLGAVGFAGFALLHGAVFLALKTEGDVRERARRFALRAAPVALLPLLGLLIILVARAGSTWVWVPFGVAVLAGIVAPLRLRAGRDGQAFAALGVVVLAALVTLFGSVYPDVLPSTLDAANSLTVTGAASSSYTLTVMSWLAAVGAPVVLVYQGWSYWVFRRRLGTRHIPKVHAP